MATLSECLRDPDFRREWDDAMRYDAQYSDMLDAMDERENGEDDEDE